MRAMRTSGDAMILANRVKKVREDLAIGDQLFNDKKYDRALSQYELSLRESEGTQGQIYAIRTSTIKAKIANTYGALAYSTSDVTKTLAYLTKGINMIGLASCDFSSQVLGNLHQHKQQIERQQQELVLKKEFDLGISAYRSDDFDLAIKKFSNVLAKNKDHVQTKCYKAGSLSCRANAAIQNHDFDSAEQDLTSAIQLADSIFAVNGNSQQLVEYRTSLMQLYLEKGDKDAAIVAGDKIMALPITPPGIVVKEQIKLLLQKGFQAASSADGLALLSRVQGLITTYSLPQEYSDELQNLRKLWDSYVRGDSKLTSIDTASEAVECFKEAVTLAPVNAHMRLKFAEALLQAGDNITASLTLEEARKIGLQQVDLSKADEIYQLLNINESNEELVRAKAAAEKCQELVALRGHADYVKINQLSSGQDVEGDVFPFMANMRTVLDEMQQQIEFWPKHYMVGGITPSEIFKEMLLQYNILGVCLIKSNKLDEAEEAYQKAKTIATLIGSDFLNNIKGNIAELIGLRHEQQSNWVGALKAYQEARNYNPNDNEVTLSIKRLFAEHPEITETDTVALTGDSLI